MSAEASDADSLRDALSQKTEKVQEAIVARFQEKLSSFFGSAAVDLSFLGEDDGVLSWSLSLSNGDAASSTLEGLGAKGVARQVVGLKSKKELHRRSGQSTSLWGADIRRRALEPRSYLRRVLSSRRDELRSDFKQAVLDALGDDGSLDDSGG